MATASFSFVPEAAQQHLPLHRAAAASQQHRDVESSSAAGRPRSNTSSSSGTSSRAGFSSKAGSSGVREAVNAAGLVAAGMAAKAFAASAICLEPSRQVSRATCFALCAAAAIAAASLWFVTKIQSDYCDVRLLRQHPDVEALRSVVGDCPQIEPTREDCPDGGSTCTDERGRELRNALRRAERAYRRQMVAREARKQMPYELSPGQFAEPRSEFEAQMLVPTYPCPLEERFGLWGEGGKWVCMEHRSVAHAPSSPFASSSSSSSTSSSSPPKHPEAPQNGESGAIAAEREGYVQSQSLPPVVVSVGCNGDTSFEKDISERFGVTVHTVDPSLSEGVRAEVSALPYLQFHNVGLVGSGDKPPDVVGNLSVEETEAVAWVTFAELLARVLGTPYVDVFKIDCEGCEDGVVREWNATYSRKRPPPLGQILMEVHGRSDVARMTGLVTTLEGLGYRMFHAEPNPYWGEGYEVAYIHESLVTPW